MRNIRSPKLLEKLSDIFEGAEELLQSDENISIFNELYVYLVKGSKEHPEVIKEKMDHQTFMNMPSPVGSTAWQMEQAAEKRGKALGEAIKAKEVALTMLSKGLGLNLIAEISGLSIAEIRALKAKSGSSEDQ